jgi:hypothetical protein
VVRAVSSIDPVVESADSNEVCVSVKDVKPPAPPSGLTAVGREGGVDLSWTPNADPEAVRIRIYGAPRGGPAERLAEVAAGETSYRDAAPGNRTTYTLTALDTAGNESPHSRPAEVSPP